MVGSRKSRGSIENMEFRFGSSSSQTSQNSGDFCRICHESDSICPLLTPCMCSGSLRYVHEMCLIQWLTASETNSCELCKFPFIMQSKIKPFNEWRSLDMSGVERRRLFCAVLFHLAAALCVIWSLCVLIERSAEEVRSDKLGWPFWTKLVVVTVGLTGGIVFMYVQCKQYLNLCSRWRARNRILLISNAPEKIPKTIAHSPMVLQRSQNSSNVTLNRNNSSILVITAPLSNEPNIVDSIRGQGQLHQQQSQIIANIENNSVNFELDDDGYSQISFKQHLRQEEGNSSRGSLHNVYDNMSISTTNTTSATTRNMNSCDTDSNFLKAIPGLQEEQEVIDGEDKKLSRSTDKARTSMFIENSDILNDQNYPKLYYRHSTFLLPTTARSSRSYERRYSDTKLLNSVHFENEFMVKKVPTDRDGLGSPTKPDIYDQLEQNIQNILEMEIKDDDDVKEEGLLVSVEEKKEKRNIFQSLPNLS